MGVFFLEVIFGFHFWIAVLKNIDEAANDLFYFTLRELGAYPDDKTGYLGHMGLPPCWCATYI